MTKPLIPQQRPDPWIVVWIRPKCNHHTIARYPNQGQAQRAADALAWERIGQTYRVMFDPLTDDAKESATAKPKPKP